MTRFARAKGSKASNERQPESATPWSEMKQQLLQKKYDDDNKEKRDEANARKINIYKEFLAERRKNDSKETKWAEFPGIKKPEKVSKVKQHKEKEKMLLGMKTLSDDQKLETASKKVKSQKKQCKEPVSNNEEDFDIEEGASADESSEEFYDIKAKLDKILDSDEFKEAGELQKDNTDMYDDSGDDDVPKESSSKVEQPNVILKKPKQTKKKLQIPSEKVLKNETIENEECDTTSKVGNKQKTKKNKLTEKQAHKKTQKKGQDSKTEKKIINLDDLDEKARKKVERKMRKHKRQAERRQLKRAQQAAEKEAEGKNDINNHIEPLNSNQQYGKNKRPNEKIDISVNGKKQKGIDEEPGQFVRVNQHLEGQTDLGNSKEEKKSPQVKKEKQKKKFDVEKTRRKPLSEQTTIINGKAIDLEYFDGFPIRKEDADRLKQLRKQMISKGLPRSEINNALKLERRRAEKALTRLKKEVCFNCRMSGHNLSECPQLNNGDPAHTMPVDICFKCGSTEHKSYECKVIKGDSYKFATCFICKEQGHLSKQCPDNPRGLYPKGGACKVCGDVTHLKKDCPQYQAQQQEHEVAKVGVMGVSNPDDLEGSSWNNSLNNDQKRLNKVIKF